MPLSNSVLRRYTPPTCTLEIAAKSSPLSRWVGQSVLKDLRFELRFDDPRKPEDQRVTIRGDRTELEVLYDAVNSYVQEFLDPSSTKSLALQTPATAADSTLDKKYDGLNLRHLRSDVNKIDRLTAPTPEVKPGELDDLSSVPSLKSNPKLRTLKPQTLATEIYLQPRGLLAHELFLGRLATEDSGPVVDLSVLQLFDLATALDEYAADVVALPNLNPPLPWKKALPAWTPTAAAVLLSVGLTTAVIKSLDRPLTTQQTASLKTGQTPNTGVQTPLTSQVPAAPTTPLLISPLPTPAVPPSIAASPKLPPPPPVTVPAPTLGDLQARQRPTITVNPSPATIPIPPNSSAPSLLPGPIASRPNPTANSKTTSPSTSSGNPSVQQKTPSASPTLPPPLPELPSLGSTSSAPEVGVQDTPSSTARTASPSAESNQSESTSSDNAANSKLSDTIPQVAEIRNYFEQRWKAPSGLTQTLEYSLSLNTDGSIQRILPLGKAAGDYIDRTNMPLPGEPFVSALEVSGNPIVRLVLTPDGKVQTFLEK
ncbi:MAG TPA: DUF4335 domain-containing protein [Coleofasciculaceae cyanobacterium]